MHGKQPDVQPFREKVCMLQLGRHVNNLEFPSLYTPTDKVVADVDVLGVGGGGKVVVFLCWGVA